jgi:hypothetical protein
MMALEVALSFAWRHWKLILGGLVALSLSVALFLARSDARHAHEALTAEKASHALDIATWRAASAKAIADNLADVRAKEGDAAIITEKANHDLESQLADARALAADYARRVRAGTTGDHGNAGQAGIGTIASTASAIGGTGGVSILDEEDVRICTDNSVKLLGWQSFYASLRTRYNADGGR